MRTRFSMSVEPMTQKDIEQVALMASQSYKDNPLVIKGLLTSETIKKNETLSLKALLQAQKIVNLKLNRSTIFNFVVRDKGQIVLAFSSCEYQYYVQNLLENLETQLYVKNLKQEFKENPRKEGEVVFEKRIFVHQDNMNKGLASKFWRQLSLYFISQGYFYAYAFTSNPKSYHIYKKMEGKLIRELIYEANDDHLIIQFCFRNIYSMAKSSYFQLKSL